MRPKHSAIFFLARFSVFLFLLSGLSGCDNSQNLNYQGYVEGEAIYLASPYSGLLTERVAERGQAIKKGEQIFKLDENPQAMNINTALAELRQAEKLYDDLIKPRRVPEVESIKAQIQQVESQLELAQIRVNRYEKLYKQKAATKDEYDAAVARREELDHRKNELQANLSLSLLGGREDQINAQQATIDALKAKLNTAQWELAQKTVVAPKDGVIEDTFYNEGEFVVAQKPVASLLSPDNIRIEFFVPVKALANIQLNQSIQFTCEGCKKRNRATIRFISPEAEYIPPLVYSRENSDKLVFRVKASIEEPLKFKPGQPVWITGIEHDKA